MTGRGDTLGHGKYRDDGHWDPDAQHSDAIVLGEGGGQDSGYDKEQAYMDLVQVGRDDLFNTDPDDYQNVDSGRMQRVGNNLGSLCKSQDMKLKLEES